ncbi:alpha-2-macroglobulin [Varanus komodoensis]|uniref:alpha-2-macroglobulin n=1 Tax=Varanus komodoensis TaxID=61221 RepID=UPI001CF79474|nr:alpha-2-macroglobulin [Varanus komodoensis]
MGTGHRLGALLLLLALLPCDLAEPTVEPQFLVLLPVQMQTESHQKICIHLNHVNESVVLSSFLEYGNENKSLIRDIVTDKDMFQCIQFQLPRWEPSWGSPKVFATVQVIGATVRFWSRKMVLIKNRSNLIFLQTDKPLYKPGERVQFRVASLDDHFRPLDDQIPLIYVQDPMRNRVAQWTDVELSTGLAQHSYSLASEPNLGKYRLVAQKADGKTVEATFDVEEYVLPKFEVLVTTPKIISVMTEELKVTACGRYTYGKPVAGTVNITVCREFYNYYRSHCHGSESQAVCEDFSAKADVQGCFSQVVKTKVFQLKREGYHMSLNVESKVIETGTGVVMQGSASTQITATLSTVTFEKMDNYFRHGLPIVGQILLQDGSKQPISNATVEIQAPGFKGTYVTDAEGHAPFSIDTTNFTDDSVTLQAIYKSEQLCSNSWITPHHQWGYYTLSRFYSPSGSYLQVNSVPGTLRCGQTQSVQVTYDLSGSGSLGRKEIAFVSMYMVKGLLVQAEIHNEFATLTASHRLQGKFTLELNVSFNMAPMVRVLVYTILPSGELVAHSVDFTVDNCFENQVKLKFQDREVVPGSKTTLRLSAAKPSLCAIKAIDESVFLLKPEAELSPQSIFNLLPVTSLRGYYHDGYSLEETDVNPCIPARTIIVDGIRYQAVSFGYNVGDTYEILKEFGVKVFTSTKIHKPNICPVPMPMPAAMDYGENWKWSDDGGNLFLALNALKKHSKLSVPHPSPRLSIMDLQWLPGIPPLKPAMVIKLIARSLLGYVVGYRENIGALGTAGTFHRSSAAPPPPPPESGPQETVRSEFPETWLWHLFEIADPEQKGAATTKGQRPVSIPSDGVAGHLDIPVTAPDTITKWKTDAFCMSTSSGIGLASSAYLTVFQPFFLDPIIPYSVVRDETFDMKIPIYNYRKDCMRIRVTLAPSEHFDAVPLEQEDSFCLCANKQKTVTFKVTPKALGKVNITVSAEALHWDQRCGNEVVVTPTHGRKDTVIKPLLVEPEGIKKDVAINSLICADGNTQSSTISLKLPRNVVKGSARAVHCVLGDILGGAIHNLQHLVQLPYGCGEQNMARLAPDLLILKYLNKTGQLTEDLNSKIIGYLVEGYQTQLKYKHSDGSYSTFGQSSHSQGSTWLTAFVYKIFVKLSKIIFVEKIHITDALSALAIRQKPNGCFQDTGTLLNNAMKQGGVDEETALTAYVTIALLEGHVPVIHSVLRNALFCLETASQRRDIHIYTLSMMAYAFSLAGKEEKREEALRILDERAVKGADGTLHWERPDKPEHRNDFPFYEHRASSAEVEITSYVMLAIITRHPEPTKEELEKAALCVKWLSKQQNPNGGFSSTQDTVVALEALSKYAGFIFSKGKLAAQVTLISGGNNLAQVHVDNSNRILLQCHPLPTVPGEYDVQVTGHGCTYLQTTLKYNVHLHQEHAPFQLAVDITSKNCDSYNYKTFNLTVSISYTGPRLVSNMAIVDVKMLSGFVADKPSVRKLETNRHIMRTEVSSDRVLLYVDQLTNMTQTYSFDMQQEIIVENLKPALVTVYDYYVLEESANAQYTNPCDSAEARKGNA